MPICRFQCSHLEIQFAGLFLALFLTAANTGQLHGQTAQAEVTAPQGSQPSAAKSEDEAEKSDKQPVLSGRIIDDQGTPVTDATVEISPVDQNGMDSAQTDKEGRYEFITVTHAGQHHVRIRSNLCVAPSRYDELPRIHLTENVPVVRDFTLPRAGRIQLQVVDEQTGRPIVGVRIYTKNILDERGSSESVSTDQDGWAEIGGLAPSVGEYILGAFHEDYGLDKLLVDLQEPRTVTRMLKLSKGKDIAGVAVCSDGKPPAGWRITALPTWWNFGASPSGQEISDDGSFALPHILAGTYNVQVNVRIGDNYLATKTVLSEAELSDSKEPLQVQVNYPSIQSQGTIEGRVKYIGGQPQKACRIEARSIDGVYSTTANLRPLEDRFVIGPLPYGTYNLEFLSIETESKTLRGITLPTQGLEFPIQVTGQPVFHGQVVSAETNMPLSKFQILVEKKQPLPGKRYFSERRGWIEISDSEGRFELPLNGHGICVLHAKADGMAITASEELNTELDQKRNIVLKLEPKKSPEETGLILPGRVVDEQQQSIDGAVIEPLAEAMKVRNADIFEGPTAQKSVQGTFRLLGLKPGREYLKVTHPDYAPSYHELDLNDGQREQPPVTLVLKRGATVRGCVYDSRGRPERGVILTLTEERVPRVTRSREELQLPTVVTDDQGRYEFTHVSDRLCVISRRNEWRSMGVIAQTIWPENNQTVTLDFGGEANVSGQLFVNGVPLAKAVLVLADESRFSKVFRATGQTDADGSFVFRGVPPGQRTLYYYAGEDRRYIVNVNTFTVTRTGAALGKIEQSIGRVYVRIAGLQGELTERNAIILQEDNPNWVIRFGDGIARVIPTVNGSQAAGQQTYVIKEVPAGKYELIIKYAPSLVFCKKIEIRPEKREQLVSLQIPRGSAVVRAKAAPQENRPDPVSSFSLRGSDDRIVGSFGGYPDSVVAVQPDGSSQISNLPADNYRITYGSGPDAPIVAQFQLSEGEGKEFDLTEEAIRQLGLFRQQGFLSVYALSNARVFLPGCEMKLIGPGETIMGRMSSQGRTTFRGPPGDYELVVEFPGFEPVCQQVVLRRPVLGQPSLTNREDREVRITLQPSNSAVSP